MKEEKKEQKTKISLKERLKKRLKKTKTHILKKKRRYILLTIILIALSYFVIIPYIDSLQHRKNYHYTPPTHARIGATVIEIYDGDQSINPTVSIFNRIVKIKLGFSSYNYWNVNLASKEQITLYSGGEEYYPINYEAVKIPGDESLQRDFYFELPRSYQPELITIQDDALKGQIEIPIDIEAEYYTRNESLKLVFDNESNEEYVELVNALSDYVENQSKMELVMLPNANLTVNLPKINNIEFRDDSSQENDYDEGYAKEKRCHEIDPETLKPKQDEVYCKYYNVHYAVQTESKLASSINTFNIYYNNYPSHLIGTLNSHDDLNKSEMKVLNQTVEKYEISTGHYTTEFFLVKIDKENMYLITYSIYDNYSNETPVEIDTAEKELLRVILSTIEYKEQEDNIPETEKASEEAGTPQDADGGGGGDGDEDNNDDADHEGTGDENSEEGQEEPVGAEE